MHPLNPSDLFRAVVYHHRLLIPICQLALLRAAVLNAVLEGVGPRDLRESRPILPIVICPRTNDSRLIYFGNEVVHHQC